MSLDDTYRAALEAHASRAALEAHARVDEALDGMTHSLQRQFGTPLLRCLECGREESIEWGEGLRGGWPKCCGYTMRLITGGGGS